MRLSHGLMLAGSFLFLSLTACKKEAAQGQVNAAQALQTLYEQRGKGFVHQVNNPPVNPGDKEIRVSRAGIDMGIPAGPVNVYNFKETDLAKDTQMEEFTATNWNIYMVDPKVKYSDFGSTKEVMNFNGVTGYIITDGILEGGGLITNGKNLIYFPKSAAQGQ